MVNRGANGKHGHHWIRDDRRIRIYMRDDWRCVWCRGSVCTRRGLGAAGYPFNPETGEDFARASLDHVHGRKRGNGNANLVTACAACNSARKHLSVGAWVERVTRRTGELPYDVVARVRAAVARPLPELRKARTLRWEFK